MENYFISLKTFLLSWSGDEFVAFLFISIFGLIIGTLIYEFIFHLKQHYFDRELLISIVFLFLIECASSFPLLRYPEISIKLTIIIWGIVTLILGMYCYHKLNLMLWKPNK
ncbi:MAG: hypothetical protein E7018_03470 [Alphaproteobacteria bacterium]|nr:hypothetical protein [Alphaproteobacteria bacterium]